MGILALAADERVVDVKVSEDVLTVQLMDGRVISVPLAWYPRLLNATEEQRKNWKISGGGFGIHWEQIDEDLSTEGLLRGAPAPQPPRNRSKSSAERDVERANIKGNNKVGTTFERHKGHDEKGLLDHITESESAASDLTEVVTWISAETEKIGAKMNKHTTSLNRLVSKTAKPSEYQRVTLLAASDMNTFSMRIEDALPRFGQSILLLDESYSALVSYANPESTADVEQLSSLRGSLAGMLREVSSVKASVMGFRDSTLSIREKRITKDLSKAAHRQAASLEGVISNIEEVESFALKLTFLIDEKIASKF